MKILFIEPCHVGFGGYFRAFNICSNLSKKGVKVDMICAAGKKFQYSIKKTSYGNNFNRYELPRFYFHFFLNGRLLRAFLGLYFGLTGRYDIIHAAVPVQLESNIPAFFLKLLGKKVVMDWDDYWEGSTIYGEYKIMKLYVAWCERNAPKFFKNMVVVSDFLKNLAEKRGAVHILKLINGVDTDQFTMQEKAESRKKLKLSLKGKYLLTFGHTFINNRAYLLFKTLEHIIKKDPSVTLFFNRDPYKIVLDENLGDKIDTKILKNIVNLGYIKDRELPYYLAASDATIFIMGDSDNERACFPIRIGSYINGGAVTVINDINSEAGNVLKKYNAAIIEKDLKKLADKTVEFLNSPALQRKLKANVHIAKQELAGSRLISSLITYYKKILS